MKKIFSAFILCALFLSAECFAALSGVQQVDANYAVVGGPTGNQFHDATASAKTITHVAVATNVATITTSAAHGYVVGQIITVAAVTNTTVNGSFPVASVTDTTNFTLAITAADADAADTGTVTGTFESPVAAGTTLVALKWPSNAVKLILTTDAVCTIAPTSTSVAATTGGAYKTVAATIYEINGKPGTTTYIFRTNSSVINFRFATLR